MVSSLSEVRFSLPYLCLNHEWPVHSHVIDDAIHIHHAFTLNLEDDAIDCNEGSCSAHSGTVELAEKQNTVTTTHFMREVLMHAKWLPWTWTVEQEKPYFITIQNMPEVTQFFLLDQQRSQDIYGNQVRDFHCSDRELLSLFAITFFLEQYYYIWLNYWYTVKHVGRAKTFCRECVLTCWAPKVNINVFWPVNTAVKRGVAD